MAMFRPPLFRPGAPTTLRLAKMDKMSWNSLRLNMSRCIKNRRSGDTQFPRLENTRSDNGHINKQVEFLLEAEKTQQKIQLRSTYDQVCLCSQLRQLEQWRNSSESVSFLELSSLTHIDVESKQHQFETFLDLEELSELSDTRKQTDNIDE
jgi:hypothetical protein